jgi:DNA-binding transcriptional MerR regulator
METPFHEAQFHIKEVVEHLNVDKVVIRFWEKEFAVPANKHKNGQRFYTQQNLDFFKTIKSLVHEQGLSVAGAKQVLTEEKRNQRSEQVREDAGAIHLPAKIYPQAMPDNTEVQPQAMPDTIDAALAQEDTFAQDQANDMATLHGAEQDTVIAQQEAHEPVVQQEHDALSRVTLQPSTLEAPDAIVLPDSLREKMLTVREKLKALQELL